MGLSDAHESERAARDDALLSARLQTVRWLGQQINASGTRAELGLGDSTDIATAVEQQSVIETATEGVASLVKDQNWCVRALPTPAGYRYTAHVLAFLPADQVEPAEQVLLGAVRGR